jgi:16S rRNA processing protein RimM
MRITDPMAYEKHILLGRITKIHGFGGAVTVKTEKIFSESSPEMESVFLEIEGRPVPFFIQYAEKAGPDILIMKFEDYNDAPKVREFIGCNVFLEKGVFSGEDKEDLQNLQGYQVISDKNRSIGIIEEIIHNPRQILLSVRSEAGKEVLIPMHHDLIQEIIPDQKILIMILPEGLTDIN